ncbi:MAG: hypothetical protein JSS70_16395 [Bacteroidetes bacterium]|nr:hypothetical protein [Bacteroidota bacterium]
MHGIFPVNSRNKPAESDYAYQVYATSPITNGFFILSGEINALYIIRQNKTFSDAPLNIPGSPLSFPDSFCNRFSFRFLHQGSNGIRFQYYVPNQGCYAYGTITKNISVAAIEAVVPL